MNQSVLVVAPSLVEAVKRGDVEGEIYRDGECYVDYSSASRWLNKRTAEALEFLCVKQPIARLEAKVRK